MDQGRREFLHRLAATTGGVVLLPAVSACTGKSGGKTSGTGGGKTAEVPAVPKTAPAGWNPIKFNKDRGNAGAIPETYHASINGADGVKSHLGKHLPYVPKVDSKLVPEGFLALMWGDPSKGYVKHPNAPKSADLPEGHWYNWIRIRKASDGDAEELESKYPDWPNMPDGSKGGYVAYEGDDIKAESGKNTVYLAALPKDCKKGDTIRVYAHCLTHGEYVDFLTIA